MEAAETLILLKETAPFNVLSEHELVDIAATLFQETFSPGEFIIKEGMHGMNFYIVATGLVKAYSLNPDGTEDVLGFLGEGECFGEISLITRRPTTASVQAVESTSCLTQPKEHFLAMVNRYPRFTEFFSELINRRMRKTFREVLSREAGIAPVESFLYTKQAKDMISGVQRFIEEGSSIREVARRLLETKAGSCIVTDEQGSPKGVVRADGLLRSVLFDGADPDGPVEGVTEKAFHSIDGESYFFDALHTMIKEKTSILVVTGKQKALGILTGFDLLRFRGREVLSLVKNIETAVDYTELNLMRSEVETVLRQLMADGALASNACKIVSEFNDKVVRKVIRFAESELGPPPAPYVWLGLGSEGRKEQTLFTDQDNAIVFSGRSEAIEGYFRQFSNIVVQGLNICGIPLCKGNVMATNPQFSGDLDDWKKRLSRWVTNRDLGEKELMDAYVFLDFRSLDGDASLAQGLRSHIHQLVRAQPFFLNSLAEMIVSISMPVGFFKNFIVEKSGDHKDRLNLKLYGLVPLVTCVKILSLYRFLDETNTLERIKALERLKVFPPDQAEALIQAFETFLTLKIRNNLNDAGQGYAFGNYIKPAELSMKQKQILKEAFWAVSELQKSTAAALKLSSSRPSLMQ